MPYLDLDELPHVFDGRLLWSVNQRNVAAFHRADYHGDSRIPLKQAAAATLERLTGIPATGPVRLLTNLRYFGYCFNPVSFYYFYDSSGTRVEAVLAEITNTPWGERHVYAVAENNGTLRRRFVKEFHVSPFMGMPLTYDWRFEPPTESLAVHMANYDGDQRLFDVALTMTRRPLTTWNLSRALVRHPWMTGKVYAAIHWQALRLWWKRCPFHPHPRWRNVPKGASDT